MRAPARHLTKWTTAAALAPLVLVGSVGTAGADDIPWAGSVDTGATRAGAKRKPFEPDTELKVTGEELARRGATNLADALDLIPEVQVRQAGRGGFQADLRGARKGWVKVLVDGVPVNDPYYGNFDISAIPVTDIVEIRVSAASASPLDGPGGPGGVIEVITLRAVGGQRVAARAQASDAPNAAGWVTGRSTVGNTFGVRASAGGTFGGRDYDVRMPDGSSGSLGEDARAANAGLRLESEGSAGTVGLDVWAQYRSFVLPPAPEDGAGDVSVIDSEDMARIALTGETWAQGWRLHGSAHVSLLTRDSRYFADATMSSITSREALDADSEGLAIAANRGLGGGFELVLTGHLLTENATVDSLDGRIQGGRSTIGEAAAGVQWRAGAWRADLAAGAAIPASTTPWPEAKLSVGWKPVDGLELEVVGARKGRMPTLRERYQLGSGNSDLAPEIATTAETTITVSPLPGLRFQGTTFARLMEEMIRIDLATGMLANIGDVTMLGAETEVTGDPVSFVTLGASYRFIDASTADDDEPLDFLPRHKVDGWVTVRDGNVVGATARVRWVDERIDQEMVLPSYTTGDVSAYWRFYRDLRATAKVDNVADSRHALRANGYLDPGRVVMLGVEGVWE